MLVEHELVAEAAVVPSPDPMRLVGAEGVRRAEARHAGDARDGARDLRSFCTAKLAPYKRIRRLEFAVLPKTISGKIRRVELRKLEAARREKNERGDRGLARRQVSAAHGGRETRRRRV